MAEIATNARLARVDMTSMVDLGFLLIISFMVSILLSKPNVMRLNMPENKISDYEATGCFLQNPLYLILGKDNRIFWHETYEIELNPVNLKEVNYGLALRELILKRRDESFDENRFHVTIYATDEANYKNVVDILDEMAIVKQDRYVLGDLPIKTKNVYEAKLKKTKETFIF